MYNRQIVIVLCTVLSVALAETISLEDEYPPTIDENGVVKFSGFTNGRGRKNFNQVSYEYKHKPNVIRLDQSSFVVKISCSPNQEDIYVTVENIDGIPSGWEEGKVLIGTDSWGCVDPKGLSVGIAVIIESISRDSNTLHITASPASLSDIFEVYDLEVKTFEVKHNSTGPLRVTSMESNPQQVAIHCTLFTISKQPSKRDTDGWYFLPMAKTVYYVGDVVNISWVRGGDYSPTLYLEKYNTLFSVQEWEDLGSTTTISFVVTEDYESWNDYYFELEWSTCFLCFDDSIESPSFSIVYPDSLVTFNYNTTAQAAIESYELFHVDCDTLGPALEDSPPGSWGEDVNKFW